MARSKTSTGRRGALSRRSAKTIKNRLQKKKPANKAHKKAFNSSIHTNLQSKRCKCTCCYNEQITDIEGLALSLREAINQYKSMLSYSTIQESFQETIKSLVTRLSNEYDIGKNDILRLQEIAEQHLNAVLEEEY